VIGGIVGVAIGVACALVAISSSVRRNKKLGSSQPVAEALGLGTARSSAGIERAVKLQAARIAFPLYTVFAVTFTWISAGSRSAGVLAGVAGALYGISIALSARRFAG
jgi:hypothetical protein